MAVASHYNLGGGINIFVNRHFAIRPDVDAYCDVEADTW
jgi:hypothetical protein